MKGRKPTILKKCKGFEAHTCKTICKRYDETALETLVKQLTEFEGRQVCNHVVVK